MVINFQEVTYGLILNLLRHIKEIMRNAFTVFSLIKTPNPVFKHNTANCMNFIYKRLKYYRRNINMNFAPVL